MNAFANGTSDPWTNETPFGGVAPSFYGCDTFFQKVSAGETDVTDPRIRAGADVRSRRRSRTSMP